MTEPETLPQVLPDTPAREPWAGWDTVIRAAGITLSIIATVLTAILELEISSLRTGSFTAVAQGDSPYEGAGALLPLAPLLAIGANLAIGWFAVTTAGKRSAIGPPWALWTLIMLMAAGSRTAEGDYLLTEANWVALVTILAGSATFAVHAYRLMLKPLAVPRERTIREDGREIEHR